jgi:hypothetical protein
MPLLSSTHYEKGADTRMGGLKERMGEKVHTRDISISTHVGDGDSIILEGTLIDRRLKEYFLFTGEKKSPGVLHHMIVRLHLEGPRLKILDVETEMPGIPRDECLEMRDCLKPIVGMTITAGFTAKVKAIVGGVNGCFHVQTLLLAMAPAAVQGYWSNRMRKRMDRNSIPKKDRAKFLPVNSCGVWREDGPLIAKVMKELEID